MRRTNYNTIAALCLLAACTLHAYGCTYETPRSELLRYSRNDLDDAMDRGYKLGVSQGKREARRESRDRALESIDTDAILVSESRAESPMPAQILLEKEREISRAIAGRLGGETEHRTPDGSFVDVLTETTAYEVDWAFRWQQAIGQSLFYASVTNRSPGIVLIYRPGKHDQDAKYFLRCKAACESAGVDVHVLVETFE